MHYYIDGYNLLFRVVHNGDELQQQRHDVIVDINRKISLLGIDATIVFDATHQFGEATRSHFKDLEIVFTAEGELADEYIISELKSSPTPFQETVVTSDKKLAWLARRRSAKTESIDEFIGWLNQRYKNKIRHIQEKDKEKDKSKEKLTSVKLARPLIKPEPTPETVSREKEQKPSSKATLEECSDYYLDVFEKEYEAVREAKKAARAAAAESSPTKPKKKKQGTPKKSDKEATPMSELDRWLKLFENPPPEEM